MSKKILKASAGTGKTYRLALEYVVSLIKGEKFSDIIVMTFTNKAIAEIEERIIKFLYDLSYETKDSENLKNSINNLYPDLALKKDEIEKIYKDLIINKEKLGIYTLDSFKINIFKNAIAPMKEIFSYEIIDDEENSEILKKVFEKISDNRELFSQFEEFFSDNVERDVEKYIGILKNLVKYRWRYIFINKDGKLKERKEFLVDEKEIVNLLDEIKIKIEELCELKAEDKPLEEYANKIFKKYLYLENFNEKRDFFIQNLEELITNDNLHNGRKTTAKKENIIQYKEEMAVLKENLNNLLSKKIFNERIIPYEKQVLNFVEIFFSIYDDIKFKEKKFTQDDLKDYLLMYLEDEKVNLIKKNQITDYMKEIIESECSSIFIDEFQDTSIAQWKLLEPFINSAKNIICVGDEKQSIYGWRDGEKNLFRDLATIIDGEEENLDTSFRSEENIVEFINEIFENILEKIGIEWDFIKSKSNKKEKEGLVRIYNFNLTKEEKKKIKEEKREIDKTEYIKTIIDVLKNDFNENYKGIGIIARKNETLSEIAEELLKNKIPYTLEAKKSIFDHKGVIPIIKLLKYFLTENIFYLLEFLRDDLILVEDSFIEKIVEVWNLKNDNISIFFENILEYGEYPEEKKIIEKISKIYKKYSETEFRNMDIVLDIIKEFGIVEIYNKENEIKNIYKFATISKNFENIKEFLEEIEENSAKDIYLQPTSQEGNSVSLLTIHKSKGLEYDTVFYILDEESNKPDRGLNFNIKFDKNYLNIEDYLVCNSKNEKFLIYLDEIFDFYSFKEKKKKEEELNNLYVALTRPKGNLFIFIVHLKEESLFKNLFESYRREDYYQIGEIKKYDYPEKEKTINQEIDFKIDFESLEKSQEKLKENIEKIKNDAYKYSLELEEKRNIGNIVHYFLENIKYGEKKEIELALKKTFSKYGALFGEKKLKDEILSEEKIEKIFKNNPDIFSKKWDIIYNEYSIYSEQEKKLYRIDRLMIDNKTKEIYIVDYKTGTYEEEQLKNYKELVEFELSRIKEKNYTVKTKYIEI